MATTGYEGVRVFSASKIRDRELLGDAVTEWIAEHPGIEIVETVTLQSSDANYHCISIILFFRPVARAAAKAA